MISKSAVMDRAKAALYASATPRTFEGGWPEESWPIRSARRWATSSNPGALSRWTAMTEQSLADVTDRIRYWKGDYFYEARGGRPRPGTVALSAFGAARQTASTLLPSGSSTRAE